MGSRAQCPRCEATWRVSLEYDGAAVLCSMCYDDAPEVTLSREDIVRLLAGHEVEADGVRVVIDEKGDIR